MWQIIIIVCITFRKAKSKMYISILWVDFCNSTQCYISSPIKEADRVPFCRSLHRKLHPSKTMDQLISNTVREAVAEATQECMALVKVDMKAKLDMLEGQLGDLKAEIMLNRVQGQETAEIFQQGKAEILTELADIKEEVVKINEETAIPLSQNVPRGVSMIQCNKCCFFGRKVKNQLLFS